MFSISANSGNGDQNLFQPNFRYLYQIGVQKRNGLKINYSEVGNKI